MLYYLSMDVHRKGHPDNNAPYASALEHGFARCFCFLPRLGLNPVRWLIPTLPNIARFPVVPLTVL